LPCPVILLNLSTRAYVHEDPDHCRLPFEIKEISYTWSVEGQTRLCGDANNQEKLIFSIRKDENIERLAEYYATQKRYQRKLNYGNCCNIYSGCLGRWFQLLDATLYLNAKRWSVNDELQYEDSI
jgi:hypothetical protein